MLLAVYIIQRWTNAH